MADVAPVTAAQPSQQDCLAEIWHSNLTFQLTCYYFTERLHSSWTIQDLWSAFYFYLPDFFIILIFIYLSHQFSSHMFVQIEIHSLIVPACVVCLWMFCLLLRPSPLPADYSLIALHHWFSYTHQSHLCKTWLCTGESYLRMFLIMNNMGLYFVSNFILIQWDWNKWHFANRIPKMFISTWQDAFGHCGETTRGCLYGVTFSGEHEPPFLSNIK